MLVHTAVHGMIVGALATIALSQTMPSIENRVEVSVSATIATDDVDRITPKATVESLPGWAVLPGTLEIQVGAISDREIVERLRRHLPGTADVRITRRNRLGYADIEVVGGDAGLLASRLREAAEFQTVTRGREGRWTAMSDPYYHLQWHLENTGQGGYGIPGADVRAEDAWRIETGDPSVIVAMLDGPVDIEHADLANAFRVNPGEFPGNGIDDDLNGFVDDVHGWNFHLDSGDIHDDGLGGVHGTAVAGIAFARLDNGVGVAGLAGGTSADTGCTALSVVVGSGGPNSLLIDDAILYAVDRGARIISMTFAIPESPSVIAAIDLAWESGVVMVAPTGNQLASVAFPARHPGVIAVGGTTHFDQSWPVSTGGPEIEIAAPSVGIRTIDPRWDLNLVGGTSYAVPQVAAAAGLLLSWGSCLGGDEIRVLLRESAKDIGPAGWDDRSGWGRLDTGAALSRLVAQRRPACRCAADLDGDGVVGGTDLGIILTAWGTAEPLPDLDGDGWIGNGDIVAWATAISSCR